MLHALTAHSIRYDGVMNGIRAATASVVAVQLMDALPRLWDRSYRGMSGRQAQIVEVRIDALVYHFDQAAPSPGGEERVVVVYGFSRPAGAPRDTSRMQGFLGGGIMDPKRGRMDKGHFASHAQGGPLDINLFPQAPGVNRGQYDGWSSRGVSFRAMERWCVENPGTFFFARPIYVDESWTPHALEYGVLRSATDLWVERFPN